MIHSHILRWCVSMATFQSLVFSRLMVSALSTHMTHIARRPPLAFSREAPNPQPPCQMEDFSENSVG